MDPSSELNLHMVIAKDKSSDVDWIQRRELTPDKKLNTAVGRDPEDEEI